MVKGSGQTRDSYVFTYSWSGRTSDAREGWGR